jgi:hypothetical protein
MKHRWWPVYVVLAVSLLLIGGLVVALNRASDASARAEALAATADALVEQDRQSVMSLRLGCSRANVTRDTQYWLVEEKLADAKVVGATATSPEIRRQFVDSAIETAQRLASLTIPPRAFPDADRPWLVDCEAAYPNPNGGGSK